MRQLRYRTIGIKEVGVTRITADWTARTDLAELVAALGTGTTRWVGGCVRDTLAGKPVDDIDAATVLTPQQVIAACDAARIRTVPTGIAHGTVTALLDGGNVEITTLRKDVSTDGRRATVAFAAEWQEDAARRDFTINALYADPATRAVHDYFGGQGDLDKGIVRFIGDARDRIAEDHLRILRYYRFQTRFGVELQAEAEDACAELAPTMKGLSRERVGWELQKLLALPDPGETLSRMSRRGVLRIILPETRPKHVAALARLIYVEKAAGLAPDPLRRLAALLPPSEEIARDVSARLRLSRAQRNRLAKAAARQAGDSENSQALAYRLGLDSARDRLLLGGANVAMLTGWTVPEFPVKGRDVIALGVGAGPQVAEVLRDAEDRWVDAGFPGRDAALLLLADAVSRQD